MTDHQELVTRIYNRDFTYRNGTSDLNMIHQCFMDRAFDLTHLKRYPEIRRWISEQSQLLVADCGANIGTSAVWFAQTFRNAHIVALEPESSNFDLLARNTQGLNVRCRQAALTGYRCKVDVYHPLGEPQPGCGHAGFRTTPNLSGSVFGVPMADILDEAPPEATPFIAKIDVEGAEEDVFSGNTSWIDRFPVLIVELHDWLYPRKRTSYPFLKAISHLDRDFILMGEHVVSIDNRIGAS